LLKVITDLTDAETNLETETGNLTDATNNLRKHQENDKQPNLIVEWLKQTKAGKMVTGVKKGVSAVGRFFGHGIEDKAEKKATVKRNALNALQKGAVVGLKGAGGLIKSISSLGLKFGVFGIIMKAIQPLMEKLMTALEGPIGDFQKKIADIFEKPEMKKAINSIVSIVGELLGKLGNILADCLPSILEALMAIAKILLPPLLTVTKWILKALSLIPKALSKLPVVGEAFGKVAEAMSRTGDALGEAGKSIKSLGDSVDTNTDQLKKGNEESKASTMRVASNGFGGAGIVENGAKYEVRRQNDLTKATEEGTAATKEVAVKTEETMNAIKTSQEEMQNMYKTLEDRVLGILTILNDVTNDIRRLNVTVHE
jgi:methyl-accepting chemotaxis protein